MLLNLRRMPAKSRSFFNIQKKSFLTNDYKCLEAWNAQKSSPILKKVNLNDFCNVLDQQYSSKGVISAIDVDVFANAITDSSYLEELKDLVHKLRLSAETGSTLESTYHATVRNYIEFGQIEDLLSILKDPLKYGIFLDNYVANIIIDMLIEAGKFDLAADVAGIVMLQEDFSNKITCALSQYACYKYIAAYEPEPVEEKPVEKNKKVEEKKIRIRYLRNPYFDDHFDIKDTITLAGKSLAWISERAADNLNYNLQILGWLTYKKYNKLLSICNSFSNTKSPKIYREVLGMVEKEIANADDEFKAILEKCISKLSQISVIDESLESSLKDAVENAINAVQNEDISKQKELFQHWLSVREQKLEEQTKRLDRAKRIQLIQEKQKDLSLQEQKLWFFENEESIDLQIEEKEKLVEARPDKKSAVAKSDENYIPPEIIPKRR